MKMALFSAPELIRLVARGDELALAALYDRYRLIIFGFLLRVLHNREEAEDVLQEVFIQVWQCAANFNESRSKPFTWLITFARSLAIKRLRSIGCRLRAAGEATGEIFNIASGDFKDAIDSEHGEVVRTWLRGLPETERNILLMAYFEGFSQSEIAEQTGVSLGTVKTLMRTGMMKLSESLSLCSRNCDNSQTISETNLDGFNFEQNEKGESVQNKLEVNL